MTDEKWQKLIQRSAKTQYQADNLRRQAEAEYERRYGVNPSDVDDDWWIDTIQQSAGTVVSMKRIKEEAQSRSPREQLRKQLREATTQNES